MANAKTLMQIELVNARKTREERKESASKAGKASGQARRQRKAMKEQMERLLAMPFNLKDSNGNRASDKLAEDLGLDGDEIDNQMAMIISLWKTAMGNSNQKVQAIREIREMVKDEEAKDEEAKDDDDKVQIINDLPFEDGDADETD